MTATFTAFVQSRRIASGSPDEVAAACRRAEAVGDAPIIFNNATGHGVEVDPFSDPPALALFTPVPASEAPAKSGRGRPRLGVVAREVTLLPRHWDWLASRPGGASAALRRLVDEARRSSVEGDAARHASEALYRVMSALAGDLPGFEAASRALYARDDAGFDAHIAGWPGDICSYVAQMADVERRAREP